MATEEKSSIQVPDPPEVHGALALFPESSKGQWRLNYIRALKQAQVDFPGVETQQRAVATREANRLLIVDEPESYEDAMDIEPWKVLKRESFGANLEVTAIDGK